MLIQKLAHNGSTLFLRLSALMLVIPSPLFIQGVVWTAGFSNYYISALIIMASLYILLFIKKQGSVKKTLRLVLLFVLGIAGQLFMETFTLFALIVSVLAVIHLSVKKKKPDAAAIVYMLACVIGTAIMFSNGVYSKIFSGEDTYQSLEADGSSLLDTILTLIKNLFGEVSLNFIIACFPAVIAVTALCLTLFRRDKTATRSTRTAVIALFSLSGLFLIAFAAAALITRQIEESQPFIGASLLALGSACAVIISICAKQHIKKIAIYFVMLLILCVPLALVFPIGPRCYSGAYILLLLIIKELLSAAEPFPDGKKIKPLKTVSALLVLVLVLDAVCYSIVFIGNCKKIDYVRAQAASGSTVIELEHTPLRFMVYAIDTESAARKYTKRFCEYYDLPEGIQIIYK